MVLLIINNFNMLQEINNNSKSRLLNNMKQKSKNYQNYLHLTENMVNNNDKKESKINGQLYKGSLLVQEKSINDSRAKIQDIIANNKSINLFESNYQGFFFNNDRQKSKQRLEVIKKIKQQYSKQQTSLALQEVQKKIRQLTQIKISIEEKKRQQFNKRSQIQLKMLERMKKTSQQNHQTQKSIKRQELLKRKQIIQQNRQKRHQFIKQTTTKSVETKQPKYVQIQKKFHEAKLKQKQQRQKMLQQKRNSNSLINKQEMIQHLKKYEQLRRKKSQQRKNKLKFQIKNDKIQNKQQFNFTRQNQQKKVKRQQKRKKMLQFSQRVKSLIMNTHFKQIQNQQEKIKIQKEQKDAIQRMQSLKKVKMFHKIEDTKTNAMSLGNNYLKQLKQKDKEKLNAIKHQRNLKESFSLPSIKPNNKSYLTEIKIKRKPLDESKIQKSKRSHQSNHQLYTVFNKKSTDYQDSMVTKIKQLSKIKKYDQTLNIQTQIDDIYSKNLKLKLAFINY